MSRSDRLFEDITDYKTIDFVQNVDDYRFLKNDLNEEAWEFAYESGPYVIEELIDIVHAEDHPEKVKRRTLLSDVSDWRNFESGRLDQFISVLDDQEIIDTNRKGYIEVNETSIRDIAKYDHSLKAYRLAEHVDKTVDTEDTLFALRHVRNPDLIESYGPTIIGVLSSPNLEGNEAVMAANLAFENSFSEDVEQHETRYAINFFRDLKMVDGTTDQEVEEVARGMEEFYDIEL